MSQSITRALLSVSDKTGLAAFGQFLAAHGVEILSTGGTAKALREAGVRVTDVSEFTGFPEMLDGRVKTLHPKVHGGILGVRENADHQVAMAAHGIGPIDLVVVNLYPFEETVAGQAEYHECVEQIDIGGPAMVRSAAKNHHDVTVVVDVEDYGWVQESMQANGGATSLELRQKLAAKAFARTAAYDAAIAGWFAGELNDPYPQALTVPMQRRQTLRYGENPHQSAGFYVRRDAPPGVATARQVQGKELSYNNINDTDAAWQLVCEFDEPAVVIVKHANPCGVATGNTLVDVYKKALACDPKSAFGGIIALNRTLDGATAGEISRVFTEVVIAPDAGKDAMEMLGTKKNLRLLLTGAMPEHRRGERQVKSVLGGYLVQDMDADLVQLHDLSTVTGVTPSKAQVWDMLFAFAVCKHVKSNAIVLASGGATIGIGAGQMSRIDAMRMAGLKAQEAGLAIDGAVLASDAFFPFADNVELAAELGVGAIIQPGGSVKDEEVIAAADAKGIAMAFTGKRHFRH